MKNEGDRTENIPINTNKAINALSLKSRTPNERLEASETLPGAAGVGAWEEAFHVAVTIERFMRWSDRMIRLLPRAGCEN